ncbi:MAG: CoA transferase, partial [Pseudomonadota bacterium]
IMEGTDICFAPVLSMAEAPTYKHNADRRTFETIDGVVQPGPGPRVYKTPRASKGKTPGNCEHNQEVLKDWGIA